MKFLTDENIAISVVNFLRAKGFDVKDIKEEKLFGLADRKILELAINEERVVLTHDKDFVKIARNIVKKNSGIILIRCKNQNPDNVKTILIRVLESEVERKIRGNLVIISDEQTTVYRSNTS